MKKVLRLYKKIGQTPLDRIVEWKKKNPKYREVRAAYAGRLDPMAEGLLLVLLGEECKKREEYLSLDKEYIFEILVGFSSDSGDVLGLAEKSEKMPSAFFRSSQIKKILNAFIGYRKMSYPIFSSKTVDGKALFLWALEGRISEIEIPEREIEIYKLNFLKSKKISYRKLKGSIFRKINSIKKVTAESKALGRDFRREEIRENWEKVFSSLEKNQKAQLLRFSCSCSSGTYIRVLAQEITKKLGEKGLCYSIKRTKVGPYKKNFF